MEEVMDNKDNKDNSDSHSESPAADRRSFMKAAVKTAVAGAALAGIAGAAGKAEAGVCSTAVVVPRSVVKAHVLFNNQNQMQISRQALIDALNRILDGSRCPACGLGGFPSFTDPGTVAEIHFQLAYLDPGQPQAIVFTEASASARTQ